MERNIFQEVIAAEAWSVICNELVAIIREGGQTAAAVAFMDADA